MVHLFSRSKIAALCLITLVTSGCASHSITSDWRNCAIAGAVASAGLSATQDSKDELAAAAGGALVGGAICALFGDKDSDGDGVSDSKDSCPNTPSGIKVDRQGCPTDLDNDGVADYLDACQGTPRGTPVDAKGCAMDKDGDGVADSKDQCPNTIAGAKVNAKGCAMIASLDGVHFGFDSAQLSSAAKMALDKSLSKIKMAGGSVVVAGHTDSQGPADYNQALSAKRAAAVAGYLISQGLSADGISSKGYGESMPVADNGSSAGRMQNRRVELQFMK
ncbi:MAG: OmpA family protein [Immundisolibacteraceae bacterium]|nr:OmpA family protein [Immundisolibacteraceae bacterium]